MSATLSADGRTLTVRVPMTIRKRGGRKLVVAPEGADWAPERREVDSALVKALARAHRWRRVLETGVHATIGEIAAAERINPSYASRVLRLTLLAPEIVEAILDGRQGPEVTLDRLLRPFPVGWEGQADAFQDLVDRALRHDQRCRLGRGSDDEGVVAGKVDIVLRSHPPRGSPLTEE